MVLTSSLRGLSTGAAALAFAIALVGCASTAQHGQSGLEATYSGRELKAVLPAHVTVAQAAAAAEAALRSGGFVMTERTVAGDRARLVGEAPDRSGLGLNPRSVVVIEPVPNGVRASIVHEPFGDEEASRRILDEMLARLDL